MKKTTKPQEILDLEAHYGIIITETDDLEEIMYFYEENLFYLNQEKKVTGLNLSDNQISDIKPLQNLEKLKHLELANNQISDIKPLQNLEKLTCLELANNQIQDINPLQDLEKLNQLHLGGNQITNIKPILKLNQITELSLSNNQISDIKLLQNLNQLTQLYLFGNKISNINPLQNLEKLNTLYLFNNQISDIEPLLNLNQLTNLRLSENKISDIKPLQRLTEISKLSLSINKISDIRPLQNLEKLNHLSLSNNQISDIRPLQNLYQVTELDLSNNKVSDIKPLKNLEKLNQLILFQNRIKDLKPLQNLNQLSHLDLRGNQISTTENLNTLKNIHLLLLGGNRISKIENLNTLKNLSYLDLSGNLITKIEDINHLNNLKNLILEGNKINVIENIENLNLDKLNLSNNNIEKIEKICAVKQLILSYNNFKEIPTLNPLKNTVELYLNNNQISDIEPIQSFEKLTYLRLNNNPLETIYDIKLESYENHLAIIRKKLEDIKADKVKTTLPTKVLLLGNHKSGKSNFSNYFLNPENLLQQFEENKSTHILNIKNYTQNEPKASANMYDFGGQDYYHGIYKAFLTNDSINLLFWNSKTNHNQFSKKDSNHIGTINFDRNYWLYQLQYYYTKNKSRGLKKETEPILLIQTHADEDKEQRNTTNENTEELNIVNEFFISLHKDKVSERKTLKASLNYLKNSVIELIENKSKEIEIPYYDANLLEFITENKPDSCEAIDFEIILNKYEDSSENKLDNLEAYLDQLCKKGLILFYPNYGKLKKTVWLNPEAVVKFIHNNILSKDIITKKEGKVPKQDFEDLFDDNNKNLIQVLLENQVIYLDETLGESSKYIIPGYLPLADTNDFHFFLFDDLRKPDLTLKFEHFIPFGFINRLICFYGGNPEKKLYWKDQILFTALKTEAKVLIQLDFEKLEIKVSVKSSKNTNEILQKTYFDIIALYWDETNVRDNIIKNHPQYDIVKSDEDIKFAIKNLLEDEDKKIPDAYLSINGKDFIKYDTLHTEESNFITSYKLVEEITTKKEENKEKEVENETVEKNYVLDKENGKSIPILPFKHFTFNKNLNNMKKIFISYSKKDLTMVNTFQDHLAALQRDGKVGAWYCTELLPGDEWDKKIQQHFDESDIVCFMVSPNFMKTDYIYNYEVKKAFEYKNSKKIVPIILDFCIWQTEEYNLGEFNALPYTAKPIKDFKNENMAWYTVVECLRLLIESNSSNKTEEEDYVLEYIKNPLYKNNQLRNIYQRIVEGKLDDNSQ